MRILALVQAAALALAVSAVAAQDGPARTPRYEVVMYEGAAPESYSVEAREEFKPVEGRALLSIRVEEGEKFHAEGAGAMFEGKILSACGDRVKVRVERSRLYSTSAPSFTKDVKLGEGLSPTLYGFGSVIHIYYFRVRRTPGDEDRVQ
jgi:hypothetical protein